MKRIAILITLLVFAFSLSAFAQDKVAKKFEWGIQAGLCMGNASGSDAAADPGWTKKMRLGFGGGVFATYKFSPQFAIQPELLYVQKGAKYDSASVKYTAKVDYIEVPVFVAFLPKVEGKIQPSIFAGPYVGFRMTAKSKVEGYTGADATENGEVDNKDLVKSTDFGLSFGAGFGYKINPKGDLFLNLRYDLGLSKIDNHTPQANVKTNMFGVMLGYRFK